MVLLVSINLHSNWFLDLKQMQELQQLKDYLEQDVSELEQNFWKSMVQHQCTFQDQPGQITTIFSEEQD